MDYRQVIAIEQKNKKRLTDLFGNIPESSGIYILTRRENGFKYAYIGQAKHLLTRLAQHLVGYQHIDLSLKKHGLKSKDNPTGWKVDFMEYPEYQLDSREQFLIKQYANVGWQLRNKTAGGQGEGKFEIAETKERKGYRDGLMQGYKNAQKDIKKLFDKNLTFGINGTTNKNKEKALQKFKDFLGGEDGGV